MPNRVFHRMMAPLLGVSLLLLVLGGYTAWYVHSMQKQSSALLTRSITNSNASQSLENQLRELRTQLNEFIMTEDAVHLDNARGVAESVELSLTTAESLKEAGEGQLLLVEIRNRYDAFGEQFESTLAPTQPVPAQSILQLVQTHISQELIPKAKQHRELQQARLVEMSHRSEVFADRVSLTLLLLMTCGVVGGLTAGIAVARGVQRSIVELSIPVLAAAGKLSEVVGPLTIHSDSSLPHIRESLETMVQHVGATVQRLQESQKSILRAEQMTAIGQLAAGLAHEIRNPLTAMRTLIQIAKQDGARSLDDRDVAVLDEECNRLNDLVQSFLDFARPPRLTQKPIKPAEAIERTVLLTKSRADRQHVTILVHLPMTEVTIVADPQQLQQVMLNLVINAIEAQPAGGRVDVDLRREPNESTIMIQVADQGAGIPADVLPRIFEPFFSTRESGTGIGLAVCQRIIEDHGGTITAENRPEGGAMFTVRLPAGGRVPTQTTGT